jgi:hypothetical protein
MSLEVLANIFTLSPFSATKAKDSKAFEKLYLNAIVADASEPFTIERTKFSLLRKEPIAAEERERLTKVDMTDRKTFFKVREAQITASEVVTYSGWSAYASPSSLFRHHIGDPFYQKGEETGRQRYHCDRGHFGEPLCCRLFCAAMPSSLICESVGTFVDTKIPWLSASPDGIVTFQSCLDMAKLHPSFATDALRGGLELKFVAFQHTLDTLVYGVSPDYLVQMQMQMRCADLPYVEFCRTWIAHDWARAIETDKATYLVGHMVFVRVYRSESMIEHLLDRLGKVYSALREKSLDKCPKDMEPDLGSCRFVRYREVKFFLHPTHVSAPEDVFRAPVRDQDKWEELVFDSKFLDKRPGEKLSDILSTSTWTEHFGPAKAPRGQGEWLPSLSGDWSLTVCQANYTGAPVYNKKVKDVSRYLQGQLFKTRV